MLWTCPQNIGLPIQLFIVAWLFQQNPGEYHYCYYLVQIYVCYLVVLDRKLPWLPRNRRDSFVDRSYWREHNECILSLQSIIRYRGKDTFSYVDILGRISVVYQILPYILFSINGSFTNNSPPFWNCTYSRCCIRTIVVECSCFYYTMLEDLDSDHIPACWNCSITTFCRIVNKSLWTLECSCVIWQPVVCCKLHPVIKTN